MRPNPRILVPALAVLAAVAAVFFAGVGRPAAAHADDSMPSAGTVTTTGHGAVDTVPDRATIAAGVRVEAASASDALARCSAAADRVVAALRAHAGKNIQTQQVSLEPQMNDSGKTTGYVAQNTVTADVAVAGAGALIDAATAAGANSIEGPSLTVSDSTALYRQALALAVADARAKAGALAKAGGFTVGPVTSVSETSAPTPLPFAAGSAEKATPVEAGTQQVTADVQVGFRIG